MDPKLQISPSLWLISRMGYNSILDTFEQNVYKLKGVSALTPAILNEKKKKKESDISNTNWNFIVWIKRQTFIEKIEKKISNSWAR